VKAEGFISPETTAALLNDGTACAVKYAIVRNDSSKDDFLTKLVGLTDRSRIISGIGERPAIIHLRDFGLKSFTSGSVCVGPRGSMRLLELLQARRYDDAEKVRAAYMPIEDARDEYSPIRVLHEAVTLAGIADMGPMLPMLSNLEAQHHARVKDAALKLLAHDRALATQLAAA
jgi:dihydrodipicolinate synthase/N-acetylneuraminate lyase